MQILNMNSFAIPAIQELLQKKNTFRSLIDTCLRKNL